MDDDEDYYFDEEVASEVSPEELERELAELTAMETRELALEALKEADLKKRRETMDSYRQDWQRDYGIDASKPLMWRLGRERELKQRYGGQEKYLESLQGDFLDRQAKKSPQRAAKKIQRAARQEVLCQPCQNLDLEQQKTIDPLRLIRLKVDDHCVCYNVVDLYQSLSEKYGAQRFDLLEWRDPTYNIRYTPRQAKRIKNLWAKVRPEGTALVRLENELALSRRPSPMIKN